MADDEMVLTGPVIGMEAGVKTLRTDFYPSQSFSHQIDTKGVRLAWARQLRCACRPLDARNDAPNPNHKPCRGTGWIPTLPSSFVESPKAGTLTPIQRALLEDYHAAVISGHAQDATQKRKNFSHEGQWMEGEYRVSVRPENRLGQNDRLVLLDSVIPFDEVVELESGITKLPLRYKAHRVVSLRDEDARELSLDSGDYRHTERGDVELPSASTFPRRFGVLYEHHPVARVIKHMHVARQTMTAVKKLPSALTTPEGDPLALPLQVLCQLENWPG